MKKNIIFLILISAIFLGVKLNVNAEETSFFESDYINNLYINREFSTSLGTIHYQTARFFRRQYDWKFSYCTEPISLFKDNKKYYSVDKPPFLSEEQTNRINALAYFGYNYKNHTDKKWYAITQILIWNTADPGGKYYFADKLGGGKRIEKYTEEINELNNLANSISFIKPSFSNKSFTIREGEELNLVDTNNMIHHYTTDKGEIKNNTLSFNNLKEGNYTVSLKRIINDNAYENPSQHYHSDESQDNLVPGYLEDKFIINIKVIKTRLTIKKIDSENKNSNSQGQGKLEGTKFKLMNSNKENMKTLTINKDGLVELENLDFGKYYLQEIESGTGYKLSNKTFEFTISENNSKVELEIENEIIKKEITLHKVYGDNNNFKAEENVTFEIYDLNNNLIESITTDENGYAKITLPYGKYIIKQINSKEGYEKIETISLNVDNENNVIYELKDYKIKVPNTYHADSLINLFFKLLIKFICTC